MTEYHFFKSGPFSQWTKSPFTLQGLNFNTCEQWMMYNKALMFDDLPIAGQILLAKNPMVQKNLGRKVKNFNDMKWMAVAYGLVVEGNMAKFTQNKFFLDELRKTVGKVIVEASVKDKRWGIGLAIDDPLIHNPASRS